MSSVKMIGLKAIERAERSELVDLYDHYVSMGNEWLRRQILVNNRIDILAGSVLGYEVEPFHLAMMRYQFLHRDNLQLIFRGAGKCWAAGTPILMHDGTIKAIESVALGDKVMGPDSRPRTVLGTHRGHGPMYRITPAKGDPFVCNEVHEVPVVGVGRLGHYANKRRTFTPPELIELGSRSKARGLSDCQWKLEKSGVIDFPEPTSKLPFDPYLVGLWLGDGDKAGTRITNQSPEIRDWIRQWAPANGYVLNDHPTYVDISKSHDKSIRCNPFLRWTKATENKHIPQEYMVSSREDRLKLLAGLLDTDGWYCKKSNYFEISQVRPWLADQIAFLARSLGFAAYVKKTRASIKSIGYEGDAYVTNIVGDVGRIPTLVARKRGETRTRHKDVSKVGIVSVDPIGQGDFYGIEVDGDHLLLRGDFTIDHNSTICTITKTIHLLLKDPNLRICISSKTSMASEAFLREIKAQFEENERLAELFGPYYDPRKVAKWDAGEIEVLPRTKVAKEASVTCIGVGGMAVGKHYDVLLPDDLVDEDNSRTKLQREKVKTWYYKVLDPTLEPPSLAVPHRGEVHRSGTRYHYDDLYGHLIANELKEHHNIIPALDAEGRSPWPKKYPPVWFHTKRKKSGIIIFNSQYQCNTEAMKGEVFQYDDCIVIPGDQYPPNLRVFMGVDLAISENSKNDKFAIVVLGMDKNRKYYVLDFYENQLRFGQQTDKILEFYKRWDPVRCAIEINAYQAAQYQNLRDNEELLSKYDLRGADLRLRGIHTDKDKMTRGWKLGALFEDKRVHFKENQHLLIEHLVLFPNAKLKDLFDAFDLAVKASKTKKRQRPARREPSLI